MADSRHQRFTPNQALVLAYVKDHPHSSAAAVGEDTGLAKSTVISVSRGLRARSLFRMDEEVSHEVGGGRRQYFTYIPHVDAEPLPTPPYSRGPAPRQTHPVPRKRSLNSRRRYVHPCEVCGGEVLTQYSKICRTCYRADKKKLSKCIDCGKQVAAQTVRCRPCRIAWLGSTRKTGLPQSSNSTRPSREALPVVTPRNKIAQPPLVHELPSIAVAPVARVGPKISDRMIDEFWEEHPDKTRRQAELALRRLLKAPLPTSIETPDDLTTLPEDGALAALTEELSGAFA